MMRSSLKLWCEATSTTLPATQGTGRHVNVAKPVARSLYRSLLRQARRFDKNPFLKVYSPVVHPIMQKVLGMQSSVLYTPNTVKYEEKIRAEFRDPRERTSEDVQAAFEALTTMDQVGDVVLKYLSQSDLTKSEPTSILERVERASYNATIQETPKLEPGTLLLSHPLATSHFDRRVILLVETSTDLVTGLVLDLKYNAPITTGHAMFPPTFWQHEMCQGGPYTVDMTMPPTASISVLHRGIIPENSAMATSAPAPGNGPSKFSWLFKKSEKGKGKAATGKSQQTEAPSPTSLGRRRKEYKPHAMIIPGGPDNKSPPLYYSKIESLPSLAQFAMGKNRKNMRIYWGTMMWSKDNLKRELGDGLWFPVTVSPTFFRAVTAPPHSEDGVVEDEQAESNFPTEQELNVRRKARIQKYGFDVQPPLTRANQESPSLCSREPLWDQIMYALGGEYRQLSYFPNPLPLDQFQSLSSKQ